MEKLGFGLDDDSGSSDQKQSNPVENRSLSIQLCNKYLTHAFECKYANCILPSCQETKGVVQHTRGCKLKAAGGCQECKQLLALYFYHAKNCKKYKCAIPYCTQNKNATMQSRRMSGVTPGNYNPSTQPSSSSQPLSLPQPLISLQQAEILKQCIATIQRVSGAVRPGNYNPSTEPSSSSQPLSLPKPPTRLQLQQAQNVSNCIGDAADGSFQVMPNMKRQEQQQGSQFSQPAAKRPCLRPRPRPRLGYGP